MSFMSLTGKELNRDIHVSTPSKGGLSSRLGRVLDEDNNKVNDINSKLDLMEESTLQGDELVEATFTKASSQFDQIAENVNLTIKELCHIYNEIGYSSTETSVKKSEIFTVIQDTILNFTNNLQREKSNIENECEWLRQQIRIILAMIGDNSGEKLLSLVGRGLVFNDQELYAKGYKEESSSNTEVSSRNFYASSPFNVSQIQFNSSIVGRDEEFNEIEVPRLSLLQQKSKLNAIFLEVLKKFVEVFKKFNDASLLRYEIIESIGEEVHSTGVSEVWLDSLPGRKDCEGYRELIEKFETIVRFVSNEKQLQLMQSDDDTAYIVSSPRKPKDQPALVEHGNLNSSFTTTNDLMTSLREVNYKLVRLIRSLKITKITQEVFLILQNEIGYCEAELNSRMLVMHETIERAFELIEILQLSEEQIASVQKRYDTEKHSTNSSSSGGLGADSSHCSNTSINNCLLDQETLQFIQSNPREFGLSNNHISYINGFTEILKKIKDTKQKKWDHYFSSCLTLWEKLGEDSQYIEEFVEINNLLTDQALMNFKMELQRLYLKRSEFIESFIVDSRGEIENLWGKLYYSQEQRQKFKYFENSSTCLDKESILNDHEMELKVLKQEYAEKIAIFDLYSQLDELIKDQNFLRESSKDSSRLLSKNSCKILLNEEKLRKKIHKNLPIVLKQLKLEIIKYNNEQLNKEGKPITIFGEDFFEKVILIESEQQQAAKPNRVKAKVVTTRSPTKGAPATNSNKITKKSSPATSKPKQPINRSPMYGTKSPMNRSPMNRSPMNTMSSISSTRSPITTKYSPYHQKPKYSDSSTMSPLKHTLKPLNTPLAASNTGNILDTSSISNTSKLSPLKTSFNGRYSISPAKTVDLDDKENSFCSKYSLSPIKITEYINGQTQTQGNSTVMNDNSTFDSSTVIGDDYQTWRTERIKQLNNLG